MFRKEVVIKSSPVIQMTNTVSLFQRKAWNILIAEAYEEMKCSERIFKIDLDKFMFSLGVSSSTTGYDTSRNDDYVKQSLEVLNTTAVKFNVLNKDKSKKWEAEEYSIIPLLAGTTVNLKLRTIKYAFSPLLVEELINPKMYAKILLSVQANFSSKHTIALHELCIDYYDEYRKKGETPKISIDDFKELMGVSRNEYKEIKRLTARLVKEPIEELKEKSEITVSHKYYKTGRKISSIKFFIKRKSNFKVSENSEDEDVKSPVKTNNDIVKNLLEHGITTKQIKEFEDNPEINEDIIINGFNYYMVQLENKKITKNKPAYLYKSIINNWGNQTEEQKEQTDKEKNIALLREKEKMWENKRSLKLNKKELESLAMDIAQLYREKFDNPFIANQWEQKDIDWELS